MCRLRRRFYSKLINSKPPLFFTLLSPRHSFPPQQQSIKKHNAKSIPLQPNKDPQKPSTPPPPLQPAIIQNAKRTDTRLVTTSVFFYGLMTFAGIQLGSSTNVKSQLLTLATLTTNTLQNTLLFLLPLLVLFAGSVYLEDKFPAFAELRKLFEEKLIPQLRQIPIWGLFVLAAAAGIGEETLFRGYVQPTLTSLLLTLSSSNFVALDAQTATAVGLGITSVIFGALHALTPLYFWFATASGIVFGVEFQMAGLQAACATHALYDFIALLSILEVWDSKKEA